MTHREAGHESRYFAQARGQQQQREHERDVVVAGGNVLDAERQIAAQAGAAGVLRARCRRELAERPARLRFREHCFAHAAVWEFHPCEVKVRRCDVEQQRARDHRRSRVRTLQRPLVDDPALRRGDRSRIHRRCARPPATRKANALCEQPDHRLLRVGLQYRVERQSRQLETRNADAHESAVTGQSPARVRETAAVGVCGARRERTQHCQGHEQSLHGALQGSVPATWIAARRRNSSR